KRIQKYTIEKDITRQRPWRVFVTYHHKHEDILGENKSWKEVNAVPIVLRSLKELPPPTWFRRTCK
ncbi:hypothetical protein, partial [Arcobacter sp.]|uniref:hypothetical protein n=1 Tax=Arcobacter sp. TaxID=1872629 RepID=UPI003D09FA31